MNELSCSFSHEVYSDGCVVALLKGLTPSPSSFPNLSLSIRAYGYMRLDIRWITNAGLLRRAASLPFAEYFATSSQDELKSNVYCIYKTQTLFLSSQDLENLPNGVFIQFDLPPSSALLPSFKGLHGTIAYHLIVTASHFTQHKDQSLFFPFRISGKGYSSPFFDVIEHDICRFYKTTLSLEHILSRTDDYAFLDECKAFNAAYSIRDDAHICIVTITSPVFQQDMIVLVFNFEGCEQRCDRIRVTFIMNEVKEDGSILHAKHLSAQRRHTALANLVYIRIPVPASAPCSFISPFFQVSFLVEVEFFLSKRTGGSMDMEDMVPEEEPFTWSVPINVLPVTHSYKSATVEAVACLGASIEDKALLDDDFF